LVIVLQVISAMISAVATMHGLQLYPSEAGLRTWDEVKRSNAQTGKVYTKPVSCETLAIEGPSAGGWFGYLQQIGYANSIGTVLSCQSGPRLIMIIT
jgi:hypothetical protein